MFQLTLWAKAHPRFSWLIITILHLALALIWAESGIRLYLLGWELGDGFWLAGILLFFLGIALYPGAWEWRQLSRTAFLRRRLAFDVWLIAVGALLTITAFNQGAQQATLLPSAEGEAVSIVLRKEEPTRKGFFHKLKHKGEKHKWRKGIRQKIKERIRAIKEEPGKNTGGKIVLLLLLAVALSFGVFILSCGIACSGAGAAAVLVAILGVVGSVALIGMFLRKVLPEKSKSARTGTAILIFLGGTALWIAVVALASG